MTPGMTLIKNSHGHDQVSVIQPPTTGPEPWRQRRDNPADHRVAA